MKQTDQAKELFFKGLDCLDNADFETAERLFSETLSLAPRSVPTLHNLLIAQCQLNKFDDALFTVQRLLDIDPKDAEAHLHRGHIHFRLGRFNDCLGDYRKAIELNSSLQEAWLGCGNACSQLKKYTDALMAYDRASVLKRDVPDIWLGRGHVLRALKRYDDAAAAYDQALALNPDLEAAWLGRGNLFCDIKRHDEALAAYDRALALEPDLTEGWLGRGNICSDLKRYDEALAHFDQAVALKPDLAEASLGRGNVLTELKRYDEALADYDKAIRLKPELEGAWLGRGNVFYDRNRHDEAYASYCKAAELKANFAEAWVGRGNAAHYFGRHDEALACCHKALAVKPDLAEAWLCLGNTFFDLKDYNKAFAAYDKALSLKPDLTGLEGARLHSKMNLCHWDDLQAEADHLIQSAKDGHANTEPFVLLALNMTAQDHFSYTTRWVEAKWPSQPEPLWRGERYTHDKIHVAYVSSDFRQHPVSYLMAGVFESHDKSQFQVTAISIGPDDTSELRRRLERSFDYFIDVRATNSDDIARHIRNAEIDILIDLNGLTHTSRPDVFARRPAPIQVNYLGYPGTMGASYIDYLISDPILIPAPHQACYAEKIVYLPHSYLPNDAAKRAIADRPFARSDFGLPERGFVFCCFNNAYKLNPQVFHKWMSILRAVDGSVLWLSEHSATAIDNLRTQAILAGVNADRLVFAERLASPAEHLARHRLADLFLDTLPYNAHTTASDALWAGLPVLTQVGETFAGRVAASLLNAIGLPELIVQTPEEFEMRAIALATQPDLLAAIKARLLQNRLTAPLFDTQLFTRHIESAYAAMYERFKKGLPPDHIYVAG